MIKITHVRKNSDSYKKGIRENDKIKKINGYEAVDRLDLIYYSNFDKLELKIRNKGTISIDPDNHGLTLEEFKVRRCNNNCIFCFVSQMPENCRKTLQIKDDDYRLSFLYGSYITLNNLREKDYERIKRLNLSPLYVSVHTVDKDLRKKILRSQKPIDIKKKIEKLSDMGIIIHTQIVLMPGINDGTKLVESLNFLTEMFPSVQTVSVVPVGLTKYRNGLYPIKDYNKKNALKVIETAEKYQKKMLKKYNDPVVYVTDEFYVKADKDFPKYKRYEIYDDGVGMYKTFKDEYEKYESILINKNFDKSKKIGIITSVDGKKVIEEFVNKIKEQGANLDIVEVKNQFFGDKVTVTGLLTGTDIKETIQNLDTNFDVMLIPDIVLNEDNLFLDDLTKSDFINEIDMNVEFIGTNARCLIEKVAE